MNKTIFYIVLLTLSVNFAIAGNLEIPCENCRKVEISASSINIFYKYFLLETNISNIRTFQDPGLYVQNTNMETLEMTRLSIHDMDKQTNAEIWIKPDFGNGNLFVMSFHFLIPNQAGFYIFYQDLYNINSQAAGNINQLLIDKLSTYGITQSCDGIHPKSIDFKKYDDIPSWGFSGYLKMLISKNFVGKILPVFNDACLGTKYNESDFANDVQQNFTPAQIKSIGWSIFFDKIELGEKDYLSIIDGELRLKITLVDDRSFWTPITLNKQDEFSYFYLQNEISAYIQACIINEYLQAMAQ